MSIYYIDNELSHYGVKGMKWGVRHDNEWSNGRRQYRESVKSAKERRKNRDSSIAKRYDAFEKAIEQPYKKGQLLSDKDVARLNKVDEQARKDWKSSKEQYKKDKRTAKSEYKKFKSSKISEYKDLKKRTKEAYAKEDAYYNKHVKTARKAMGGNPLSRTIRSIKADKNDKGYQAYMKAFDRFSRYNSRPGNGDELWTKQMAAYQNLGRNKYSRWIRSKRG